MVQLLLMALLCGVLVTLFSTLLISMQLIQAGRSDILDAFKKIVAAIVRRVLLRPIRLIPTGRMTSRLAFASLAIAAAGVTAGILGGTSISPWLLQTKVIQVIALPLLSATAVVAFLMTPVESRGIATPVDLGRNIANLSLVLFAVVCIATYVSDARIAMVSWSSIFVGSLYGSTYIRKSSAKYLARVANDVDVPSSDKFANWTIRVLWRMAEAGFVPLSYALTRWIVVQPSDRDEFKLRAVLAYHMHRYTEARDLAELGNRSIPELASSEMLTSYHALAIARISSLGEAIQELRALLAHSPSNYYCRSNLSYLLWSADDLDAAVGEASRAISEFAALHGGRVCAQTATYLSLFLCEQALDRRMRSNCISRRLLGQSLALAICARDVLDEMPGRHWGSGTGSLIHNIAFACMLSSDQATLEERDELFSFAFHALARCVWQESHAAARFRLALFHMIGSRSYDSAEYQLSRILWALRNQPERQGTRFGRLVLLNRERVRKAKKLDVVFGPEILFQHASPVLIPESAVVRASSREETTAKRREWMTLSLGRVIKNPLRCLPPAAASVARLAPEPPWLLDAVETFPLPACARD